jgi:hypothetical protein
MNHPSDAPQAQEVELDVDSILISCTLSLDRISIHVVTLLTDYFYMISKENSNDKDSHATFFTNSHRLVLTAAKRDERLRL